MVKCAHCQEEFKCGGAACWCFDFPAIFPIKPDKECYCPSCLKKQLKAKIKDYTQSLTPPKLDEIRSLGPVTKLEQGIDYELNNGLFVFSKWYHLRRGNCCGSGCINCPYPVQE